MTKISEDPDSELIRNMQESMDQQSFKMIMDKYKDRVYNFCYRFFGNAEDARDCSQDIFIRIYQSAGSFRSESLFSTWLYQVMLNTCRGITRSKIYRQRRITRSMTEGASDKGSLQSYNIPDKGPTPEHIMIDKEKKMMILKAINSLNKKQKTILIFRDLEGRSYEEIARITGTRIGTVRSILARGRLKIAEIIKNEY